MRQHVIDANALFRFLRDGDGAEVVEQVFTAAQQSNNVVLLSLINWGEVYYTLAKHIGLRGANSSLQELKELPLALVPPDLAQTRSAAEIKLSFGLPYADAFAAALVGKSGILVTADFEHFSRVPWLRLLRLPPKKSR